MLVENWELTIEGKPRDGDRAIERQDDGTEEGGKTGKRPVIR